MLFGLQDRLFDQLRVCAIGDCSSSQLFCCDPAACTPWATPPNCRRDAGALIRVYPEKSCGMLRQLRDAVASNPGHETVLVNVRSKLWSVRLSPPCRHLTVGLPDFSWLDIPSVRV